MELFFAENPCPQCSHTGASYKFHGPECDQFPAGEHMHRQCGACGYEWAEQARQTLRRAASGTDESPRLQRR